MKKIILIVIASLMFANIGFAKITLIEEVQVKGKYHKNSISTVCIDGHKFVFMRTGAGGPGRAQAIVQFWKNEKGYKPVPANC
jgi:hypothetical protein|tara:strand:- start:158 stop:406 length:249 start_codon:yes stop_codon:yes gene_type:complete